MSEITEIAFDDLLQKVQEGSVVVVDVRNPEELADTGKIPGAVNIPLPTVPDVFRNLTSEKFEEDFGFPKTGGKPIVFHCRAGGRARAAIENLQNLGIENDYLLYIGSWMDWVAKGGPVQK